MLKTRQALGGYSFCLLSFLMNLALWLERWIDRWSNSEFICEKLRGADRCRAFVEGAMNLAYPEVNLGILVLIVVFFYWAYRADRAKYPRRYFLKLLKEWKENEKLGWTSTSGALQAIWQRRERPFGINIKTRKYFQKWLDADALENLDKLYAEGDLLKIRAYVHAVIENLDEHLRPELR